jgi:hypothetical protein
VASINCRDYKKGENIMRNEENEVKVETAQRFPLQAAPVLRRVVDSAISGGAGVEASDNDHNTDTEHDIFFVDMS